MNDNREERDPATKGSRKPGNSHIKWFAIIMAILIVLLVVLLDYCTRTGDI